LHATRKPCNASSSSLLRSYDVASSPLGSAVLPLLYCHRLVLGGWKVLARRK